MNVLILLASTALVLITHALPTRHDHLRQKFIKHRLDLLENGFSVFANEFVPEIEELQKKVSSVTKANKELSKQLKTVLAEDDELSVSVKEHDKVISNLLWAVANLKDQRTEASDKDTLLEIEWTLFDLKHSTDQLLEQMCIKEVTCRDWSEWSICSTECGNGTSSRSRECVNEGKFKPYCEPTVLETINCTETNCPVKALKDAVCPEHYDSYQGYCFRFSGRLDSRPLSTIICETDDAHLVLVDSRQKHDAVMGYVEEIILTYMRKPNDVLDSRNFTYSRYFEDTNKIAIDGIRPATGTEFVNWKNEQMDYFLWAAGEPRNEKKDGDYCITISLKDYEWYQTCCTERYYYICEATGGGSR